MRLRCCGPPFRLPAMPELIHPVVPHREKPTVRTTENPVTVHNARRSEEKALSRQRASAPNSLLGLPRISRSRMAPCEKQTSGRLIQAEMIGQERAACSLDRWLLVPG